MRFTPPLQSATLLRRYKRFLADIRFDDGREETAHVANSGAMLGVDTPGARVWVQAVGPGRKLPYSLKFVETATSWAGVDTLIPNQLVGEALRAQALLPFAAYAQIRAEAPYGARSRVDFLLSAPGLPDYYVEVKNCHLSRRPELAEFPDCLAARSARHMDELSRMVDAGARAAVVITVQRSDCTRFAPAADIDPDFAAAFAMARRAGVEVFAYACRMSADAITLADPVAIPALAAAAA
jgi:sugar fermentation stimulation protein A